MARLIAALLVALMLGLALVIYVELDRPVNRVVIRGQLDDAEREQIRGAVRTHLNGGLLSADLDALADGILRLDWPRSISIRRDWPGTLEIDVEKPAVIAYWQDAYLASDGGFIKSEEVGPWFKIKPDFLLSQCDVFIHIFQLRHLTQPGEHEILGLFKLIQVFGHEANGNR